MGTVIGEEVADILQMKTSLYRIDQKQLTRLQRTSLGSLESDLQQWIWDDPGLLGEPMALLGREVPTDSKKRIDLLAIDQNQQICVIELKRDKTPREVVAQALDYASWIADVGWDELDKCSMHHFQETVAQRFENRFGSSLTIEESPEPRMIIVASQLDEASERIARFLTDRGVAINALFFSTFQDGPQQLLVSNWLIDLEDAADRIAHPKKKLPTVHSSSGFWFVNVGALKDKDKQPNELSRSWADNRKYGFLSAGGGRKYEKMISNIPVDQHVFAYLNGYGYVGFGVATSTAIPIAEFYVDGKPLSEFPLEERKVFESSDDYSVCDYAIAVKWIRTLEATQAVKAPWHSVMTVCSLNQPATLAVLKEAFSLPDD